jgi:hypothetical protein
MAKAYNRPIANEKQWGWIQQYISELDKHGRITEN